MNDRLCLYDQRLFATSTSVVARHLVEVGMRFEWDETKRRANIRKHGIDFVRAALIFENAVLTRRDNRRDYGEDRYISLGMIETECFSLSGRNARDPEELFRRGKADKMIEKSSESASLAEIRQQENEGRLHHDPAARQGEDLGTDFWQSAEVELPGKCRSV